jgi:hypothetical protein
MKTEPQLDPRQRTLEPTQEETDAWADREHKRRAAWLTGPSDEEKHHWAQRYRRRAVFGLEESRLGPTRDEIDGWAAREHNRRQAWLAGPTDTEKQEWARGNWQDREAASAEAPLAPTAAEIEAWSARERQRRQDWLAGPSEEEKREWARQQGRGLFDDLLDLPGMAMGPDTSAAAQRLLRELELVGKGTLYALSRLPKSLWTYFVSAGEEFEQEFYQKPRRTRIRF